MKLTGFDSPVHDSVASLPKSWGFPALEVQRQNLSEAFDGMTFAPVDDYVEVAGADRYVYAPRRQRLMDFYGLGSYSDLTWRIAERAQLDFGFVLHDEVRGEEVSLDQTLSDAAYDLDCGRHYDWYILPITAGWVHQGYSANQIVQRAVHNRQYPLGLWQYAAMMMALRPKLETADNHFLICAADHVYVNGYCCPMFRLHHTVELGFQDRQTANVYTGAIAYLLG